MNIKLNPKEMHTIDVALKDSKNRITRQMKQLSIKYSELPENLKFLWTDEDAYKQYTENTTKECSNQLKEIEELEGKLEQLWKNVCFIL